MSEETKREEKPTKSIETNAAQILAERDHALELLKELTDERDFYKKEAEALQGRVDEDTKAGLINEIAPMTKLTRDLLALKSVDELKEMKKVLSNAKIPAFKAGTPVTTVDKSPAAKLANAFDDYASKTWRKS